MNAKTNSVAIQPTTAESIMLRSIELALPDLSIVSWEEEEIDIRDASSNSDVMLDWHYPGRSSVWEVLPDLDFTDVPKANQELSYVIPRNHLVTRGIFASSPNASVMADV